ncbi:unnamed protein product, partial [marine sediment metagenome]
EIQESKDYTSINIGRGWKKSIYEYITENPNKNNVFLISALLS